MTCKLLHPSIARQGHGAAILILLALLLTLTLGRLSTTLLVILLKRREILTRLRELTLLHTFADIPVDERALGVHEVKLVVDAREELGDGGGVGHHCHSAHDLGKVATRHDCRRLVVDATFEAGRAPID